VVDLGCSHYMVNDRKLLSNLKIYNGAVKVSEGSDTQNTGVGNFLKPVKKSELVKECVLMRSLWFGVLQNHCCQ
jgi:hypothetical protein